jgi:hypothetical protein
MIESVIGYESMGRSYFDTMRMKKEEYRSGA